MKASKGILDPDARRVLSHYWRVARGRPLHVVLPLGLALLVAGLEGASFSLLVPLADAVSTNGFDFMSDSRFFGWIPGLLPEGMASSPNRDAYLVLVTLGLVVLLRTAKMVVEFGKTAFLIWRNEAYMARAQERTFARILSFGRQYFDLQSLGRLDVELGWSRSVVAVLSKVEDLVRHLMNLTAKLAVMVFISVPLSITLVVVFPVLLFLLGRITRGIERLAHASSRVEIRTKSQVLDLLSSIPLVKVLSQEEEAISQYGAILDEERSVATRRGTLIAMRWPIEEILVLTTILAAQGLLIWLSGRFDPGDMSRLAVFLLVVQQTLGDLKGFGMLSVGMAEERPKLRALARFLDDADKHVVTSGTRTFKGLTNGVSIRGLSFAYADGSRVLSDIRAEIQAGAFTAVVGESGAGKTTLVNLLARSYECPPGTIFVDGVDVRDFSLPSLYRRMGIVSQEAWILNRTLRENLVFGLERPPLDEVLHELLVDVHLDVLFREHEQPLDMLLGDRGVQLSGGQRQRVALVRVLLRNPDILILDEATSALDSVVERKVADAIDRRFQGRTMIVIAHRLSTLRRADRILVLKEGRLVEVGRWNELLARDGEFARLHDAQFLSDST